MNFLAHLWLAERAALPLAGAVLGDVVRGRLDGRLPPLLERSIALHRRIDVVTDAHPLVIQARARFENGQRRYAGIVLDVLHDHALALAWPAQLETLDAFARARWPIPVPGNWLPASRRRMCRASRPCCAHIGMKRESTTAWPASPPAFVSHNGCSIPPPAGAAGCHRFAPGIQR